MTPSLASALDPAALAAFGCLGGLLAAAAWHDFRAYRIPNAIVFPGTLLALTVHAALPGGLGLAAGLGGMMIGLAALWPLYWIGAAGAGDVKLMGMTGAFLGPVDAVGAALATVLAGALLAAAWALKAGVMRRAAENLRVILCSMLARFAAAHGPSFDPRRDAAARMPYSLAIAAGTALWLAFRYGR